MTITEKQNAMLNRCKVTLFVVRDESGIYCGQYAVKGHNAIDSKCLAHFEQLTDE